jgi:hypothetical protein
MYARVIASPTNRDNMCIHAGGMCSALVLLRALSSRGEARSNLVCHPLEHVLSAATCHVMLPDAPCLPAACLLTAWPATPVPCSPLMKSGVHTMTPANPGCSLCSASYSCYSLSSQLPVHGTHAQRHRALDGFVRLVGPVSRFFLLTV